MVAIEVETRDGCAIRSTDEVEVTAWQGVFIELQVRHACIAADVKRLQQGALVHPEVGCTRIA